MLQGFIQYPRKQGDVCRFLGKLHQPLVTAFAFSVHEDRGCRIFQYLYTRLTACFGQAHLDIVYNQLFTKGIYEELGASCDDELVWVLAGETHRVANHVAPQSAGGTDEHGIVPACLHSPKGHDMRIGAFQLVHGDELIEDTVVEHEAHGEVGGVVLNAEEAFAGIVGLHVVHVGRRYQFPVLLAVRRERHTSMEEHFQIGPHLGQVVLTCNLQHTVHHGEHP